jgi:uncharacterized protein (DUF427 family)
MTPIPDPHEPRQESVWAYPRPAVAQVTAVRIQIIHRRVKVADSCACIRTLETSHPPSYYDHDGMSRPHAAWNGTS